jgi:hypothetical protein
VTRRRTEDGNERLHSRPLLLLHENMLICGSSKGLSNPRGIPFVVLVQAAEEISTDP